MLAKSLFGDLKDVSDNPDLLRPALNKIIENVGVNRG